VLVDEIAHARSEVEARPVVGDVGVAPRAVDIHEQENIRRAVADVLVVDPSGLPGLGLNRDPRFTDQLPGRFVETDHGSPRVGRLGVEIEHVFHARHVLGVDRRNAPHLLPPRLQLHLRQSAPHRGTREGLMRGEADQFARQQIQRPAGSAGRGRGARHRDQARLIAGAELARRAGSGRFVERAGQAVLDEVLLRPIHGRCADPTSAAIRSSEA